MGSLCHQNTAAFTFPGTAPGIAFVIFFRSPAEHGDLSKNRFADFSGIDDIDYVLNFVLDEEEIVRRLSGRRLCKSTGRIYHIVTNPPKKEGIDDETGEPLIQRDDDKPEAIRHRLEVYKASTEPLIGYYKEKGLLVDIDASVSPEEVLASIIKAVNR